MGGLYKPWSLVCLSASGGQFKLFPFLGIHEAVLYCIDPLGYQTQYFLKLCEYLTQYIETSTRLWFDCSIELPIRKDRTNAMI